MIGRIGSVGRIGTVGGAQRWPAPEPGAVDFTPSNTTVATSWGTVTVGELTPINAPPGAYFVLVETAGPAGDDAGLAVVNG